MTQRSKLIGALEAQARNILRLRNSRNLRICMRKTIPFLRLKKYTECVLRKTKLTSLQMRISILLMRFLIPVYLPQFRWFYPAADLAEARGTRAPLFWVNKYRKRKKSRQGMQPPPPSPLSSRSGSATVIHISFPGGKRSGTGSGTKTA